MSKLQLIVYEIIYRYNSSLIIAKLIIINNTLICTKLIIAKLIIINNTLICTKFCGMYIVVRRKSALHVFENMSMLYSNNNIKSLLTTYTETDKT